MAVSALSTSPQTGRLQGAAYTPAVRVDSLRNDSPRKPCLFTPRGKRLGDAIQGQYPSMHRVPLLLGFSFPPHISRLIVTIIVNAAKSVMRGWRSANICQESLKGLPAFTDRDSAPPVAGKAIHRRILTTPNHGVPRHPFFGRVTVPFWPRVPRVHVAIIAQGVNFGSR